MRSSVTVLLVNPGSGTVRSPVYSDQAEAAIRAWLSSITFPPRFVSTRVARPDCAQPLEIATSSIGESIEESIPVFVSSVP